MAFSIPNLLHFDRALAYYGAKSSQQIVKESSELGVHHSITLTDHGFQAWTVKECQGKAPSFTITLPR
jgi:hypothetical protein